MNELVEKVLSGDRDAFRAVVREHGPGVRAYLAANLNDAHTVDDIAQETFIAAYESLDTFRAGSDLGPWLKGIAHNKLLMHLRRLYQQDSVLEKLRTRILEEVAEEAKDATQDDRTEVIMRVRDCVDKLPDRVRAIVRSRYFDSHKVQDIAAELTTTVSAVSSMLYRGRKLLESCIQTEA